MEKVLRWSVASLLFLMICPAAPSVAVPPSAPAGPVFLEAGPPPQASETAREVVRARAVRIDFHALEASVRAHEARERGARIGLNLFSDRTYTAVLDRVTSELAGTLSWIGHLEEIEDSRVTLVWGGGVLVGSVTEPGGSYRIQYSPEGVHVIEEVDLAALPNEGEPIQIQYSLPPGLQNVSASFDRLWQPGALEPIESITAAAADDGSTFDLLVVYSPAARNAAGGTTGIQNLIALGVSETNTAFANSAVIPRLRLVHTAEVSYTESGTVQTDLARVQSPSDGYIDVVHSLRNIYKADMVQLLVEYPAGDCGVAYLMPGSNNRDFENRAFSVSRRICVSPNYTFGHELGHVMGCNHAPGDGTGTGAFSYSFGYKDPGRNFRTIMAYDCSTYCPRVLRWSNPNLTYNGLVTGTSTQNNALSINNVRGVIANFRQSTSPYSFGSCAWSAGIKESSGTYYTCPGSKVMVGRQHSGDENGTTWYNCCDVSRSGVQAVTYSQVWSASIKESSGTAYTCPAGKVMVGRQHSGDENGYTRYNCAYVDFGGITFHPDSGTCAWSSGLKESSHNYVAAYQRLLVGRQHSGDENGTTWYYSCNLP